MGNLPEREVRICMALHLFRRVPGTDRNNKTVRMKFAPFLSAEREALELILSENIIELQFTDNQILIKIQSKTKSF